MLEELEKRVEVDTPTLSREAADAVQERQKTLILQVSIQICEDGMQSLQHGCAYCNSFTRAWNIPATLVFSSSRNC